MFSAILELLVLHSALAYQTMPTIACHNGSLIAPFSCLSLFHHLLVSLMFGFRYLPPLHMPALVLILADSCHIILGACSSKISPLLFSRILLSSCSLPLSTHNTQHRTLKNSIGKVTWNETAGIQYHDSWTVLYQKKRHVMPNS